MLIRQTWPPDRLTWTTMTFASLRIIQNKISDSAGHVPEIFVDTIQTAKVGKQQKIRKEP